MDEVKVTINGASDDITFCYYRKCKNRKCFRHPSNIRIPYIPHSFAFYKDCEHWEMEETYYETQEEGRRSKK